MNYFDLFDEILDESTNVLGELPKLSNNNYDILIKDRYLTIYYKFGDFSFLPEFIAKKLKQVFLIVGFQWRPQFPQV